ncbi:hypothetical protein NMY22_g18897 [Coprinellus aureogranulatus]|nr:hypothetical protein NMY22_g18897 [Coprinellus aureogranulatus]
MSSPLSTSVARRRQGHILLHGTPTMPQRRAVSTPIPLGAGHSPSPRLRSVSPLAPISVHQGRVNRRVNPYSVEHAYLTGHVRTPTPSQRSRRSGGRGTPSACSSTGDPEEEVESYRDVDTPRLAIQSRLTLASGDVAVATPLRGMHGSPHRIHTSPNVEGGATTLFEGSQGDTDRSSEDPEFSAEADNEASTPDSRPVHVEDDDTDTAEELTSPPPIVAPFRFLRSPYQLRRTNRETVTRLVREQVRAVGLPLDAAFLRDANIKKFNPAIKNPPTKGELFWTCTAFIAVGITIREFGRIMRGCVQCERYTFIDSIKGHNCEAAPYDPTAEEFSITAAIFRPRCPGMDAEDIEKVFSVCDTCRRVYITKYHYMHDCTKLGAAERDDA